MEKPEKVEEVIDTEETQHAIETPVVNEPSDESGSLPEQGETFEKVGNDFLNWFKKDKE
ncbi:MAG: hypothetical protein PHT84_06695 [Candidatus Pacebacteria bacterium]|nr:hypothetical protein [Candidatus Paceibacterota bacterium]